MAHAGIRPSFRALIGVFGVLGGAHAAPNALPISETPSCRVGLTKVSYDDPAADDGEFIELFVERLALRVDGSAPKKPNSPAPPPACSTSHDAGARSSDASMVPDAQADGAPRELTLADCGLAELRLVNGGAAACDEYRTIPLGTVVVPDDGFVVVCAQDSVLAATCDVNTAGRSAIKNGFLQNGPNDGFRFMDVHGAVSLEAGYEGGPACFSGAAKLADETGDAVGQAGQDDVNVVCAGSFGLMPAARAPLRTANPCRPATVPGTADAGAPDQFTPFTVPPAPTVPVELAPDAGFASFVLGVDASFSVPPRLSSGAPEPPSCGIARRDATQSGAAPLVAVSVAAVAMLRRRRRRPRPALRADCSARCERALRR